VQLNGLPAVAPEAQLTVTNSGCPLTMTLVEPDSVTLFASVTLKVSGNVPLVGCVTLKVPVPVYGPVPPVAETVQVNALPAVAVVEHDTVTMTGCATTLTLAVPVAVTPFASVTVNVSVLVPFAGSVLLIVPVPVYGAVPPLAVTVQLNGLPAVTPEVGHDAVTTRGWPPTVTLAEADAVTPLASVTLKVSVFDPLEFSVRLNVPVPL